MNLNLIKNLELKDQFFNRGYQVFDGVLDELDTNQLASDISETMKKDYIRVDQDGIRIKTLNGNVLAQRVPKMRLLYEGIHLSISKYLPKLMMLVDLPVAISANLIQPKCGDGFRYHFDRNEYTAVLFLTNCRDMPLCLFPNIRTDPIDGDPRWHYSPDPNSGIQVQPRCGRLVFFTGRKTLHGVVEHHISDTADTDRISLQFAYDSQFQSFEHQHYYGRPTINSLNQERINI